MQQNKWIHTQREGKLEVLLDVDLEFSFCHVKTSTIAPHPASKGHLPSTHMKKREVEKLR